jgi:hypothetical protein
MYLNGFHPLTSGIGMTIGQIFCVVVGGGLAANKSRP